MREVAQTAVQTAYPDTWQFGKDPSFEERAVRFAIERPPSCSNVRVMTMFCRRVVVIGLL